MLVLARRLNEKVVLPGLGVTVQVLEVRRGTVRLGITAPPEVTVLREEMVGKPRRHAGPEEPAPCAR
jgi:carbon storage regulator CsrA